VLSFPLAFRSSPRQTGVALPFVSAAAGAVVGLVLGGVTLWRRRERPVPHR
jgi:LPXTG-motif cell wall-anchored protein